MSTLSSSEIEFFNNNGYLTLPSITTGDELESLKSAYDKIFANRCGRENGDQFDLASPDEENQREDLPQILSLRKYAPEFLNTTYEKNCLAIAQQLIGPDAQFEGEHAILKPGGTGKPVPWHQDEAYWNPKYEYKSISFWMPLQDATLLNGCMEFIPNDPTQMEIYQHQSIGGDTRVHGLEIVDPRLAEGQGQAKAKACPIPAGGVTIHDSRTLHYTGPNLSDEPRRAYILTFGLPPKLRPYHEQIQEFSWNVVKKTARAARIAAVSSSNSKITPNGLNNFKNEDVLVN